MARGRIVEAMASNKNPAVSKDAPAATDLNSRVVVSKTGTARTRTGHRHKTVTSQDRIKTPAINPEIKNNEALKQASGFTSGVFYFC